MNNCLNAFKIDSGYNKVEDRGFMYTSKRSPKTIIKAFIQRRLKQELFKNTCLALSIELPMSVGRPLKPFAYEYCIRIGD